MKIKSAKMFACFWITLFLSMNHVVPLSSHLSLRYRIGRRN